MERHERYLSETSQVAPSCACVSVSVRGIGRYGVDYLCTMRMCTSLIACYCGACGLGELAAWSVLGGSTRRRLGATRCSSWQGLLQRSKRSALHLVNTLFHHSFWPFWGASWGATAYHPITRSTLAFPSVSSRLWVSGRPPRPAATHRRPLPTRCQHYGLCRGSHDRLASTPRHLDTLTTRHLDALHPPRLHCLLYASMTAHA